MIEAVAGVAMSVVLLSAAAGFLVYCWQGEDE